MVYLCRKVKVMKKEKSCGTICINDGKVLVIKQKQGFYGFPKGHVELGETEIETAIRETKEETNIDVKIDEKLRFTLSYIVNDTIDKEVVYFAAYPLNENIVIQQSELLDAKWVDIEDIENILTFDNLKDLWKDVLTKIKK